LLLEAKASQPTSPPSSNSPRRTFISRLASFVALTFARRRKPPRARGGLLGSAASLPQLLLRWNEPPLAQPPHPFLLLPALKLSGWHFQHESAKTNLNYTCICLLHISVNLLALLPGLLILLLWDCTRMVLSS